MRRALALLILLLLAFAAACGGGDGTGGGDGSDRRASLPPRSRNAIAAPFTDELERLHLRVTRAAVVDRETGRPSPNGTHLAVYVEPTGTYTPDDFAAGIVSVARVFLPAAFDRWGSLTSFDVCQEPVPGVDDREVPAPKTQIDISRAAAAKVDWAAIDLEGVLALAARDDQDIFTVFADEEVAATSTFREHAPANAAAGPTTSANY